jgi:hypothetical protein
MIMGAPESTKLDWVILETVGQYSFGNRLLYSNYRCAGVGKVQKGCRAPVTGSLRLFRDRL